MWWLWCTAAALAGGDPATELRSALSLGDVRSARAALARLDAELGSTRVAVSPEALSMRFQAEGAIGDLLSREKDMLQAFAAAWVVAPTGRADLDVLTRPDLVTTFQTVQSTVFQRTPLSLDAARLPDAPIRIDGRAPGAQPVFPGRHHVQVLCADGTWSSRWSSLTRSEDWGHACADGALAASSTTVADDGTVTVVAEIAGPMAQGADASADGADSAQPAPSSSPLGADLLWYERGIQWVRDFELPRSPKGRLLLGGPVVGLGTGGELQFVPGGDSGGVFTTLSVTHMPVNVGSRGLGALRLSAGEVGVGYQPSQKGRPGFEVRGGVGVFHDTLLYTDGYLYLDAAAGARWDAPGTGMTAFVGMAAMANWARWNVAPRASVGWQF